MIESFKKLLVSKKMSPSFFAVEIIERLYQKQPSDTAYGMTELYESISQPKPTFSSYRKIIDQLSSSTCVVVKKSRERASKKSIRLNKIFRKEIDSGCLNSE